MNEDPGWYEHPPGTVAMKAADDELRRDGIDVGTQPLNQGPLRQAKRTVIEIIEDCGFSLQTSARMRPSLRSKTRALLRQPFIMLPYALRA
jgi:hypothetical protein